MLSCFILFFRYLLLLCLRKWTKNKRTIVLHQERIWLKTIENFNCLGAGKSKRLKSPLRLLECPWREFSCPKTETAMHCHILTQINLFSLVLRSTNCELSVRLNVVLCRKKNTPTFLAHLFCVWNSSKCLLLVPAQ